MMYKTRHKCQELTTGHVKVSFPLLCHTGMFLHGSIIMRAPELAQGTLVRRALWTGYEPGLGLAFGQLLACGVDTGTKPYCAPLLTGLMCDQGWQKLPAQQVWVWERRFCTEEALAVSLFLKLPPLLQFCSPFPTSSLQWKSTSKIKQHCLIWKEYTN